MTGTALKLYELSDQRHVLEEWLWETEGELTPEVEAELAALDGAIDEKIQRVALYIRELDAATIGVRAERDRLQYLLKRNERSVQSLKDYLQRQMESLQLDKVDGPLITVRVQNNPLAVTLDERVELEALYEAGEGAGLVQKVSNYTVDKRAALDAYKAGTAPAWIGVRQGRSLRIK